MSTTPLDGASSSDGGPGSGSGSLSTPAPTAPAPGWYPTPDGEQRFWDGGQWLALPAPVSDGPVPPPGQDRGPDNRRAPKWALVLAAAVVLLALVGGIAWKVTTDRREAEAAAVAAAASSAEAEREAQAREEQEREEAAAAAQEAREEVERQSRRESVTEIEASVREMAEGHVVDELIDGPIIEVTCSPVGGGSTDDLTEQTTVFDCFVANEDNGDGTLSGYGYNATMNWSTGQYTYSLGDA